MPRRRVMEETPKGHVQMWLLVLHDSLEELTYIEMRRGRSEVSLGCADDDRHRQAAVTRMLDPDERSRRMRETVNEDLDRRRSLILMRRDIYSEVMARMRSELRLTARDEMALDAYYLDGASSWEAIARDLDVALNTCKNARVRFGRYIVEHYDELGPRIDESLGLASEARGEGRKVVA